MEFEETDMNTGKIPYKNKAREAQRQARMVQLRAKVASSEAPTRRAQHANVR